MQTKRSNVFETNSSSSHSISIRELKPNDKLDMIYPDANGILRIYGGKFGWGIETHYDIETKASYIATDCHGEGERWMMLKELLILMTGAKDVVYVPIMRSWTDKEGNLHEHEASYVDHQSSGTSGEACVDMETLKNYLFNPESNVHIDNDSH